MANVTYLIGAGASAGKRDNRNHILEGLPCVNEITDSLKDIVLLLEKSKLPETFNWKNPSVGLNNRADWQRAQSEALHNFQHLLEKSSEHATIDTYAKKLRLRKEMDELRLLEQMLSLFFLFLQLESKPDSRYDSFLASILQMNLHFPDNIHVLSWNYDSQFEIAYSEYNQGENLITSSKESTNVPSNVELIKINGTASFDGQGNLAEAKKKYNQELQTKSTTPAFGQAFNSPRDQWRMMQLVFLYQQYVAGKKNNTHLSFAFDDYLPSEQLYNRIDAIMAQTDALVIIGYTFPFFNREIDRRIFDQLNMNADIYIQDLNPEQVEQSLKAVWESIGEDQVHTRKQVNQFFLPPEL